MRNIAYLFSVFCLFLLSCNTIIGDERRHGCALKTTAMKLSSDGLYYDDGNGCTGPIPVDNINLSSNELRFNAEGGIDSITTKGKDWDMLWLNIGDTVIDLEYYITGEHGGDYLYESGTILTDEENEHVISIEHPWFSINKPENKKIIVSVKKNETGKERTFSISIVDDRNHYYTSIKVSQSAE